MSIESALRHYASHAPLDLLHPSEIQHDLKAIAGDPHMHRRSIGSDACDLCGRDLRDEIHARMRINASAKSSPTPSL